jgi:hypothetical protein
LVPHASTTPASSAVALRVESPLAISNVSRHEAIRIA